MSLRELYVMMARVELRVHRDALGLEAQEMHRLSEAEDGMVSAPCTF